MRSATRESRDETVGGSTATPGQNDVDAIGEGEVHLTVAGVERPVVLRRRALPPGTTVDVPAGAVDVRELPDHLRPQAAFHSALVSWNAR